MKMRCSPGQIISCCFPGCSTSKSARAVSFHKNTVDVRRRLLWQRTIGIYNEDGIFAHSCTHGLDEIDPVGGLIAPPVKHAAVKDAGIDNRRALLGH